MNEFTNSVRSFVLEAPFPTATTDPESDMDIDSIRKAKVPPLRRQWSDYDDPEIIENFTKMCRGQVIPKPSGIKEIFQWCVNHNEKNALVWWLEKNQHEDLIAESDHPGAPAMIAYALCRNSSIKKLFLTGVYFTAESAKELGNAFKVNRNLDQIYLADPQFTPNALSYLAEGLRYQVGSKCLRMCGLGWNDQNPAYLIQALENCDEVSIILSENQFNFDSVREIFGAIKQSTKINQLSINYHDIDEASMREIASCLKAASGLKKFGFMNNRCEPAAALLLEEALIESNLKTISFDIGNCDFVPAVSFDKIIKKSFSLSDFSLDAEYLNNDDIGKVFSELTNHPRMQCFSLTRANLNEKNMQALTAALQGNENLRTLELGCCSFPENAGKDLCEAIEKNTVLEHIGVYRTNISEEHATRMENLGKRNYEAKRFLQQDALLYSRMALPAEIGALLANQVLMLSDSTAAYESATIEVALSIQALAANTQNGPQQAAAHSGKAPLELPPGCTLV